MYDVLIVGAGWSGAVLADQFARIGNKKVLVLESRDHIGGNCYDYVNNDGINMNKYGAHLFHTRRQDVWEYVQQWGEWVPWEHRVLARVFPDDNSDEFYYTPVPICLQTLQSLHLLDPQNATIEQLKNWFREETAPYRIQTDYQNSKDSALARVGPRLYKWIFQDYTIKQWAKDPVELAPSVLDRIPVRLNSDDRYFTDPYQALPLHGYTSLFSNIFNHPGITVQTGIDYFNVEHMMTTIKTIVFTGAIDRYYAYMGLDKLEYRSIRFEEFNESHDDPYHCVLPASVINEPSLRVPYTRTVEYKQFLNQPSYRSVLVREYTTDTGDPFYPVPNKKNQALYSRYQIMSEQDAIKQKRDIHFIGRLAGYKYMNMDEAIGNALDYYNTITTTHPQEKR